MACVARCMYICVNNFPRVICVLNKTKPFSSYTAKSSYVRNIVCEAERWYEDFFHIFGVTLGSFGVVWHPFEEPFWPPLGLFLALFGIVGPVRPAFNPELCIADTQNEQKIMAYSDFKNLNIHMKTFQTNVMQKNRGYLQKSPPTTKIPPRLFLRKSPQKAESPNPYHFLTQIKWAQCVGLGDCIGLGDCVGLEDCSGLGDCNGLGDCVGLWGFHRAIGAEQDQGIAQG